MILNRNQTAIKYIPVSNWTMATEGIELIGQDDKRQITATFVGTLTGKFLYNWCKKERQQTIEFLIGWHMTHTANHWCNKETMTEYIKSVDGVVTV